VSYQEAQSLFRYFLQNGLTDALLLLQLFDFPDDDIVNIFNQVFYFISVLPFTFVLVFFTR
jgi:hypothetical protein